MGEVIILEGLENFTFTFYHHGFIIDHPKNEDKQEFTRIIQYKDIVELGRGLDSGRTAKNTVYVKTKDMYKEPWKLWHVNEKERDRMYERIRSGMRLFMENKHKWSTEVFLSKIAFEPVISGEFKEAQERQTKENEMKE